MNPFWAGITFFSVLVVATIWYWIALGRVLRRGSATLPPSDAPSVMCIYQQWVKATALYPPGLSYPIGTLTSEAGECQGAVIKVTRRLNTLEVHFKDIPDDLKDHFKEELSDVVWAMAATLNECGMTFEELVNINRKKLEKRAAEGGLYSSIPR